MAFTPLTTAQCAPDSFFTTNTANTIKDDLDDLNARAGGSGGGSGSIINGSFELDSDDDGVPDGWTVALYSGGSQSLDTSTPAHGAKALKFTHPGGAGNGGGYATGDYFEVDEKVGIGVRGHHWCTAAGMKCEVRIYWYTKAKGACSTAYTTLYSSTSNPTSVTLGEWFAIAPSTARYARVRLFGGIDDTNVAGDAFFDGFEALRGQNIAYVAGDNILISSEDEKTTTSTSSTVLKKIRIDKPGTLRIAFYLQCSMSGTAYAQIFRNGTAVGTLRDCTSFTQFSEDISGWSAGDYIIIKGYVDAGSGGTLTLQELCVNTQTWGPQAIIN